MTNLDSILKSRDITLPTKAHIVKAMVFPVVTYRCESWTIKKAEQRRTDAFELYWRRLLSVPWTARRSNQSKGNQSCIFIGRSDAEAETPILWPPDVKSQLVGTDLATGNFLMSQLLASGGQNIGASSSASVFPMNIQGLFPLGLTV